MNFIQQAYKGKTDWWRFILTVLATLIGWQVVGMIPLMITAVLKSPNSAAFEKTLTNIAQGKDIEPNLFLFVMILSFAIGLFFLLASVFLIHKRPIRSVITSRKNIDWKRVFFAFGLWFSLAVAMLSLDYFANPEHFEWHFKLQPFLILVLISLLLLPLQTSFEEILFRGYFMQGIGIAFKNAWVPLFFTAIAFGLLHGANPEVDKLGYGIFVYYIGTGLFFGIATLMDEGLELSLGMHAANNIVAAVFVTTHWTAFQTDALLLDTSEPSLGLQAYLPVFVIYPLILWVYSKKYAWKNWKEKLFGKIRKPIDNQIDSIGTFN